MAEDLGGLVAPPGPISETPSIDPPRWPFWVALAIHPAVIAVLFQYRAMVGWPTSSHPIEAASAFFFALTFAQLSLLGIWVALGKTSFVVRLPIVLLLASLLPLALEEFVFVGRSEWSAWVVLAVFQMLTLAIPLFVVRRLGVQFETFRFVSVRQRAQFHIRHLLQWTIGAALLLAFLRWIVQSEGFRGRAYAELFVLLGVLAASNGIVALMGLVAVMGKGPIPVRAGWLAATVLIIGMSYWYDRPWGRVEQTVVLGLQATIVVLTLLAARRAGYQLVRGGAVLPPPEE